MATDLGKVGIVMKGSWNSSATYENLDAVSYNNSLYIAKQNVPANTVPTNTTYWQPALSFVPGCLGCVAGSFSDYTDCNDIPIGTYLNGSFAAWGGITSNKPNNNSFAGILYCLQGYGGDAMQVALYYQWNTIFFRRQSGTTWTSWNVISVTS